MTAPGKIVTEVDFARAECGDGTDAVLQPDVPIWAESSFDLEIGLEVTDFSATMHRELIDWIFGPSRPATRPPKTET